MKKNQTQPNPEPTESSGNFATGFFLGVIGGTIGTLLFSTDKGQSILSRIREEFEPQIQEALENPEIKSVVDEFKTAQKEVTKKIEEAKEKFPKFSARQPKS